MKVYHEVERNVCKVAKVIIIYYRCQQIFETTIATERLSLGASRVERPSQNVPPFRILLNGVNISAVSHPRKQQTVSRICVLRG